MGLLALFIGIILENFANVGSETKKIRVEDLECFRKVWLRYDPKGTFVVPSHNLLAILQQLRLPLGIADHSPPLSRAQMLQHLGELDIPDHGGSIHFMEALTALSHSVCGTPVPLCDATKDLQKAAQKVPKLNQLVKPTHNVWCYYLVALLQARWRGYTMRKTHASNPLMSMLTAAQLLEIHESFAKFDRNGDGHIPAKELATVMRIMGTEPTKQQLQDLTTSVAIDGNGKIKLEEFSVLMGRRILMRDSEVPLSMAFELFDARQSGYVTANDIRTLMTTSGGDEALTATEVDELVKMAGPDQDGKIVFDAFKDMECWKIPEDIMHPQRPTQQPSARTEGDGIGTCPRQRTHDTNPSRKHGSSSARVAPESG